MAIRYNHLFRDPKEELYPTGGVKPWVKHVTRDRIWHQVQNDSTGGEHALLNIKDM